MFRTSTSIAWVGVALVMSMAASSPAAEVQDELMGDRNGETFISEQGQHVGKVVQSGSRVAVAIDGKEGPKFDEIIRTTSGFGRKQYASVMFSPNGASAAYFGRRGDQAILVIDGREVDMLTLYPQRGGSSGVDGFTFSNDGKHYAYIRRLEDKVVAVRDGQAETPYDRIDEAYFYLTPDASRLIYYAGNGSNDNVVVVDGKPDPAPTLAPPQIAGNGNFAFIGYKEGKYYVIHNGKPSEAYGGAAELLLSPDGERIAYIASTIADAEQFANSNAGPPTSLCLDGKPVHKGITSGRIFSPSGKRFAFIVQNEGGDRSVVVDGTKGLNYQSVTNLQFSPGAERVAYVAQQGGSCFFVIDDQESDAYQQIDSITFSPDGKRFAYRATKDNAVHAVVDGKPGPAYRRIEDAMVFSPDGTKFAYVGSAGMMKDYSIIVNEQPISSVSYEVFGTRAQEITPGLLFSPDSKHFIYLGHPTVINNQSAVAVVVDGKPGPAGVGFGFPRFSPDGKHFAYTYHNKQKVGAMLDGMLVAEFDDLLVDQPHSWGFAADHKLRGLGVRARNIYRVTITPDANSSIDQMPAAGATVLGSQPAGRQNRAGAQQPQSNRGNTAQNGTNQQTQPNRQNRQNNSQLDRAARAAEEAERAARGLRGLFNRD
jgi:WD40 repeat protein